MGQAKARGTAETRTKEGVAKRIAAETARKQAIAEAEALLTPEQREHRKKSRLLLAQILALTA